MKSSSFFFEEEIIFEDDAVILIKNPKFFAYIFYYLTTIFLLFFFFFVVLLLGLDVFYERILLLCYFLFCSYIVYLHFKDSFSLFSLSRINKKNGVLEFFNKKGKVRKTIVLGKLQYFFLEHVTYGGGRASFASVVLVGDKSKISLKKFEFQHSPSEAFDAAYQWAIPIANYLEIDVKKEI